MSRIVTHDVVSIAQKFTSPRLQNSAKTAKLYVFNPLTKGATGSSRDISRGRAREAMEQKNNTFSLPVCWKFPFVAPARNPVELQNVAVNRRHGVGIYSVAVSSNQVTLGKKCDFLIL